MRPPILSCLCVVMIASWSLAADPKPLPPELSFIPRDCAGFISVRYDKLNATPLGKALVFGELHQMSALQKEIEEVLGFALTEIKRLTLVYPQFPLFTKERIGPPRADYPLFVVTRNKPFDRVEIQKKIKAYLLKDVDLIEEILNANREKPRPDPTPGKPGEAYIIPSKALVYFVDDSTILICKLGHADKGLLRLDPVLRTFGQMLRP